MKGLIVQLIPEVAPFAVNCWVGEGPSVTEAGEMLRTGAAVVLLNPVATTFTRFFGNTEVRAEDHQ